MTHHFKTTLQEKEIHSFR